MMSAALRPKAGTSRDWHSVFGLKTQSTVNGFDDPFATCFITFGALCEAMAEMLFPARQAKARRKRCSSHMKLA
jgi:hypothetical protein